MFGWMREKWRSLMQRGLYPSDPKERLKIKMHILGAGAGCAMKAENGVVKITVEDKNDGKKGEGK